MIPWVGEEEEPGSLQPPGVGAGQASAFQELEGQAQCGKAGGAPECPPGLLRLLVDHSNVFMTTWSPIWAFLELWVEKLSCLCEVSRVRSQATAVTCPWRLPSPGSQFLQPHHSSPWPQGGRGQALGSCSRVGCEPLDGLPLPPAPPPAQR